MKKAAIIAMQKLPIADPKVPRIEMAPEEPFSTTLDENTSLGLDFEKNPISVAQVSAVAADNDPR